MILFLSQEIKFKDAIRYYEPIVKKHADNVLDLLFKLNLY